MDDDDFVREQIAGDELDPDNVENLIATGFLRMGPWEQTGMSVFKETRGQWLDDVTDTVGQAFLAHSMLCCKCHDHKFDPIPTRDYYRMMAVFSTTQFAERDAPFLNSENCDGFKRSDDWIEAKVSGYENQKRVLNAKVEQLQKQESGEAKVGDNGLDPGDEASLARMSKNILRHRIELDRSRALALSVYTGATIHRRHVSGRIEMPANPWTKGEIENDVIRSGGDVYAVGDAVQPGALSAAESLGQMTSIEFPAGRGKRRLALADWMVDPSNPLTPRVIVNRVWSWHFGKGIAANPNNFGGTGGLRDPFMEAFNQPGPDKSCELRETSIVAPQALKLLNSQEVLDRAIAFADRIIREELASEEASVRRAFQLTLARSPTPDELASCVTYWRQAVSQETAKTFDTTNYPDKIERTVMAEKTGKPYTFIEEMPAYATFQPDLTLAQVDACTRGLAHVMLVLLNTNEFCYLD